MYYKILRVRRFVLFCVISRVIGEKIPLRRGKILRAGIISLARGNTYNEKPPPIHIIGQGEYSFFKRGRL